MAAYRPKSLDELNNQYDKVKSAELAIRQGKTKLSAEAAEQQGAQRVTWNYDPAKYRISKEEAAALTGSIDQFIKDFSAKERPAVTALRAAQAQLQSDETQQPQLRHDTAAAFEALLARAKAETAQAAKQAQIAKEQADVAAVAQTPDAAQRAMVQSADAPVREGELSGLMEEYMRVMNDDADDAHDLRFRRRKKERHRAKAQESLSAEMSREPVAPSFTPPSEYLVPEGELDAPLDILAPEQEAAIAENTFDEPEAAMPLADEDEADFDFELLEGILEPVEEPAFEDAGDEVTAEDAFDAPEAVMPLADEEDEDFELLEAVLEPVEEPAFEDAGDEVTAEDAFDEPEALAPVADEDDDDFELLEEVLEPFEEPAFEDAGDEVTAEDAFDAPEAAMPLADEEDEDFELLEAVLEPVEEPAFEDASDEATAEDAFDAPEALTPFEDNEDDFELLAEVFEPVEEPAFEDEDSEAIAEDTFDAPEAAVPQETPETEEADDLAASNEADAQTSAYPMQFEDVQSYSDAAPPEDRFIPDAAEPPAQENAPAGEAQKPKQKKEKRGKRAMRGLGKFFCVVFLIASLLSTALVCLFGTALGVNSGTPAIGNYYLFTAANTYAGTGVDAGDLVICQGTGAIANNAGVVFLDANTHSFSFGVKTGDRVDEAQNKLVYEVADVTVAQDAMIGAVAYTVPRAGAFVRYIIDHFWLLICGCAALDALFVLLLILLSLKRKTTEEGCL